MATKKHVQVYFGKGREDVYKALTDMRKKYGISTSTLAFYAMEAGLGVVQHHFEEMKSGAIGKRQPIKK